jgi:Mg/Co/Ni transporter MgtE
VASPLEALAGLGFLGKRPAAAGKRALLLPACLNPVLFDGPYFETTFLAMIKKRAGWLVILFLGEMLTATAMNHFEHEIERAVVLSLFIPLLISSGGNSGSQATSLIIRALALREVA